MPNAEPPASSISAMVSSMVPGSAEVAPARVDCDGVWDARGHRDGRALGRQPLGDRAADSPAATGHQSCFTG